MPLLPTWTLIRRVCPCPQCSQRVPRPDSTPAPYRFLFPSQAPGQHPVLSLLSIKKISTGRSLPVSSLGSNYITVLFVIQKNVPVKYLTFNMKKLVITSDPVLVPVSDSGNNDQVAYRRYGSATKQIATHTVHFFNNLGL